MAKSKRRAKRSGRTKVAGAAVGAGCTAPTSGLKDVHPPKPNWNEIGIAVTGVPGLDEETVRYLLDHQEDEDCREMTSRLAAYLREQERSESDSQSSSDSQTSGPNTTAKQQHARPAKPQTQSEFFEELRLLEDEMMGYDDVRSVSDNKSDSQKQQQQHRERVGQSDHQHKHQQHKHHQQQQQQQQTASLKSGGGSGSGKTVPKQQRHQQRQTTGAMNGGGSGSGTTASQPQQKQQHQQQQREQVRQRLLQQQQRTQQREQRDQQKQREQQREQREQQK